MLERISEPVSGYFIKQITNTSAINILDLSQETVKHKNNIFGSNYNFNYGLNYLLVSYSVPSLANRPYREYNLADTEEQERVAAIEWARLYNEITTDENGKFYATKLTLQIEDKGVTDILGEVLLYNSLIRLNLPLMQYIGTRIMSESTKLKVNLSHVDSIDKIIVSGSYNGNVNYTFDSGHQSHIFPQG